MARRRRGSAGAKATGQRTARRRVRRFTAAVLLTAAGVYGAAALGSGDAIDEGIASIGDFAARTSGLTVQDVTVSGRSYTSAHEILEALGARRGQPITAVDTERARDRVLALDWVRTASVMRLYPDTIHVSIEEHDPLAIWQSGEGAELIDDRGAVVSGLETRSFPHLPMLLGPGAAEAAPGFITAMARRPSIARRVASAVRVGERRWTLRLDNGVEVLLPEDGMEVALDALINIDQRTGLLSRNITKVDMRLPDRVTVLPAGNDGEGDGNASASTAARTDRNT